MEYLDDEETIETVDINKTKWTKLPVEENEDHPDFEEFDEDYLMSEPWESKDMVDEDEEYLSETTSDEYLDD